MISYMPHSFQNHIQIISCFHHTTICKFPDNILSESFDKFPLRKMWSGRRSISISWKRIFQNGNKKGPKPYPQSLITRIITFFHYLNWHRNSSLGVATIEIITAILEPIVSFITFDNFRQRISNNWYWGMVYLINADQDIESPIDATRYHHCSLVPDRISKSL